MIRQSRIHSVPDEPVNEKCSAVGHVLAFIAKKIVRVRYELLTRTVIATHDAKICTAIFANQGERPGVSA
jgi:hypothetical protein